MTKPVSFLFIITDQQRADYLGCYGHPLLQTPHIDAIAGQGTRFERCFVASPVCMPNRASLLTGRYPSAHGVRYNGNHLSWRANTFVDVLRQGGYRTAHIGKSHIQPMTGRPSYQRVDPATLGDIDEAWKDDGGVYDQELPEHYHSTQRYPFKLPFYGYDHVDMVTLHGDHCGGHYLQWLREQTADADYLRDRSHQLAHNYSCPQAFRTRLPEELYPTSYIRDRAIEFIDTLKYDDQPFFTFVSFPDPHHPFTPPGKYWDMYNPHDFAVTLPYEAHKNPPPPLIYAYRQLQDGSRITRSQDSFMAHERELQEAMALTCGMISMLDDAVGEIITALQRSGRYDETVIIFTSDHGDYLGDFNLLLKGALPLQAITRVPLLWSDAARRNGNANSNDGGSGSVSQALVSTLDLAPSIIERAGLKPYWGIQGRSLSAQLQETDKPLHNELLIEYQDTKKRMGFPEPAFVRSLQTDDYRLTLYKGQNWGELYDLQNDPHQTYNCWDDAQYAGVRAELTERLARCMMDAVDQSPRARWLA